ncbi:hypothetical protein FRX31_022415 [Thalictrum thalictroides]|uniref:Uncharacterized protein n=1 Tax=Thalictrum thalictroides TaxID=46969 RepID=A0A7J6VUV8_THATH|nr:hypothetical protein FRX31_022415 [Thalictrum thalictroides]
MSAHEWDKEFMRGDLQICLCSTTRQWKFICCTLLRSTVIASNIITSLGDSGKIRGFFSPTEWSRGFPKQRSVIWWILLTIRHQHNKKGGFGFT